jgi:ADP-heptose:LPS heptosyltransferase
VARRILLLRLERIGDLLMTLGALESVRATWPDARIDLVVGSWNLDLARHLSCVDHVEALDVPWLTRGRAGAGLGALLGRTRQWRRKSYDLGINLEGDIRSNVLLGLSGAACRVGFVMAGGGAALTHPAPFVATAHTDDNTRRLVAEAARALKRTLVARSPSWPRLTLPDEVWRTADGLLAPAGTAPLVGLHVSGGRAIKQWHPVRFGEAAGRLARTIGGRLVLTGTSDDRPLVDAARIAIPAGVEVADLVGPLDLPTLAAVLGRLTLYVTGDTGPMHLAAAMGTPVVAVFGLSDPRRYAPLVPHRRVVRIDLACSPCNRVRRPPTRCEGHVPDCLEGISAETVYRAGLDLLAEVRDRTGLMPEARA